MIWSLPHQINLTFGRRAKRLLAAVEAQEDETILDNGFSGHGLVWFVHPDLPRLIESR